MNRAICLGEILIDCFSEEIGRQRGEVTHWAMLPGGAPANIACALAKLGSPVDFVGAVGKDPWGDALLRLLDDVGVGHIGVQRRIKAPTRKIYFTLHASDDPWQGGTERTFAGFSDDLSIFADAHLFADAIDPMLFVGAKFLSLGTLSMAYPDTHQSVERAVALALEHSVSVLVDVNWQPMYWARLNEAPALVYKLIQRADYLKVTGDEAEWLFATQSASAIAQQLPQLKGVLITTGKNGCQYWLMGNSGSFSGFEVDVEDTIGANDAFSAGFLHQMLQRDQQCLQDSAVAREVVTYASAVSALTMTRPGAIAALPTPKEIDAFLYLNHAKC